MGFFRSLLDSVTNAADFVVNNAGTIANVVKTVASVAALAAEDEDGKAQSALPPSDTDQFDMADFIDRMDSANNVLAKAAEGSSTALVSAAGTPGRGSISTSNTFSGLWQSPATLDPQGNPPLAMTQDIASMLDLVGFPQVVTKNKTPVNVANSIGQAIFGDQPLNLNPDRNSENSAFSVVPVTTTMTPEAHASFRSQRAKLTRLYRQPAPSSITTDGVDVNLGAIWAATVKIFWIAGPYAAQLAPIVYNIVKGPSGSTFIEVNTITGSIQTLKIQGLQGQSPAALRQAVMSAVGQATSENTNLLPSDGTSEVHLVDSVIIDMPSTLSSGSKGGPTNKVPNGSSKSSNGAGTTKAKRHGF
ncbi:MAG: hypothetical protein Q9227_007077 [Pyrenula ochraceoflavens]